MKKLKEIIKNDLCTGCGTCISLCPEEALQIFVDYQKGIYIPSVIESKCKNCSICVKVCPGQGIDLEKLNYGIYGKYPEDYLYGNFINNYLGYSLNEYIRYHSSSGGLVTSILLFALDEGLIDGALVTKMSEDNPLRSFPFIARTREEIIEASGSKYCPAPANIALKEILDSANNERFAVVGLPCQIQGIRKACELDSRLNKKILFFLGLFCAKSISFLGTEFLFNKLKIDINEVKKLSYRGEGWPGKMKIDTTNGEIVFNYKYYYKFLSFFDPWRCTLCFDPACALSDISLGDAWIPEIVGEDTFGTSIIVSRSIIGDRILNQMADNQKIKLIKTEMSEIKKSQNNFSERIMDLRARYYINKLCGKMVPSGYFDLGKKPSRPVLFKNCIFYILNQISIHKNLWFILQTYHRIRK